MKNKALVAVVACLALIALVRSFGKPVLAQVRAALVQSVDEPARNAFGMAASNASLNPYFTIFAVPAGKRYAIEQSTASCDIVAATSMSQVAISTSVDGVSVTHTAPAHVVQVNGFISGTQVYSWSATGLGPIYADPGTNIQLISNAVAGTGGTNIKGCTFWISGHSIGL